jgi:hypothetical protein
LQFSVAAFRCSDSTAVSLVELSTKSMRFARIAHRCVSVTTLGGESDRRGTVGELQHHLTRPCTVLVSCFTKTGKPITRYEAACGYAKNGRS